MKSKPKYISIPTLPAEWNAKPIHPLVRKELRELLAKYKYDTVREARSDDGDRPIHLCNVVDLKTQHNAGEWLRDIFGFLPMPTGYFRAGIELPRFTQCSRELRILWLSAVIAGRKTFRMPIPVMEIPNGS